MVSKLADICVFDFTQRNARVLRSISAVSGRVKIDVKHITAPYDTRIVNASVVSEDSVLWLEYEVGNGETARIELDMAVHQTRKRYW